MGISARKRRGRRIVLSGSLALLTVHAVMTNGINRTKLYWADPEYGTTIGNLNARKKEFPDRPLVVVLGTSRSRNGVDADRLSEPMPDDENPPLVYDGCLAGAYPIHFLMVLRRLIAIGAKPRAVTIELLPLTMQYAAPLVPKRDAIRLRYDDLELVREHDPDRTWEWIREWCGTQAAPWYTHRYTLTSRYAKMWAPRENIGTLNQWTVAIGPYGYAPLRYDPVPEPLGVAARKVAEDAYRPNLRFGAIDSGYDRALRALLKLCADERIDVLGLVLMPESTTFRTWYSPATTRLIRDYSAGLAAEFGTRVVDASQWVPDELFLDGHHLTEHGSFHFSDRFRRDVIRPWSKSSPPAKE